MRVLIINTSEQMGGAAIAANRLTRSLQSAGVDSQMLVLHKESHSNQVISIGKPWQKKFTFAWERLIIWINNFFSRKNLFTVSIANSGFNVTRLPEFQQADIIHLHWINQGMLSLRNIKAILSSGKPVVWTMHDMWECTGICHHAYTCELFKSECGHCRFLRFPGKYDLAYRTFKKKQRLFRNAELNVVTVSNWLARQVKQSTLLGNKNISVIPNTLSLSDFPVMDKAKCRKKFSFPDKHLILFGAARVDDPIKGFDMLIQAINHLIAEHKFAREELHLVIFGDIKYPVGFFEKIPIGFSEFGLLASATIISMLYSASDVTVSASHYETFGQTLIEAQACGCLPISFGNSGQTDIIQHKVNGYLADYLSIESLADGIYWGITQGKDEISREEMRKNVLSKYSGEIVAGQYIHLYQEMLKTSHQ